jgi:hypothetical protein
MVVKYSFNPANSTLMPSLIYYGYVHINRVLSSNPGKNNSYDIEKRWFTGRTSIRVRLSIVPVTGPVNPSSDTMPSD